MKKIILILFIVLGCFIAQSQTYTGYTNINAGYNWLRGLFSALGAPAGGNAAFQTGQAQRAGALYYDSTGADSGFYYYSGTQWRLIGGSSIDSTLASQGLLMSGDTVVLGSPIGGGGSYFSNERVISTNRKIMHWTNGVQPTSGGPSFLPTFPTNINWSPYQFISSDTVTANDLSVPNINVPLAGMYASRQIYFADGIIRNQKMNGHNFQLQWNWKDTFSLATQGGDYNVGFKVENMYLPRGTGRQGVRASHGTGQTNSRYYAAPTLLVNTFLNNSAGNYIKVNGHLSGVNSYIVMGNVNSDTIGRFIYYTTGGFIPSGSNIGISYDFAPASYFDSPIIDSAYGWFDTARVKRHYWANKTVIGPSVGTANTWSSSDQLKVLGNVNITDSLKVSGLAGYWNNIAANYNARSFTDKNYVDSAIAAAGGGPQTLEDVINNGNTTTAAAFFDGANVIFNWNAGGETGVTFATGTSSPGAVSTYLQGSHTRDSTLSFIPAAGASKFDIDGSLITVDRHLYMPDESDTLATRSFARSMAGGTGSLTVGTTAITSGTNTSVLYNNSGVLGEYTVSGSGNVAMTASPVFTGTPTIPTPFTLGATSVTSTGTQLNYLNAATGTTGTTSSNLVFSASPTFTGTVGAAGINTSGFVTAGAGVATNSTAGNSNFYATGSTSANRTTVAAYLNGGAAGTGFRAGINGSTSYTITAGDDFSAFVVAGSTAAEAGSGTHRFIGGTTLQAPVITNAAGATTNAATLRIVGPPTGITPTNPANSIWVESGNALLTNGNLSLGTAGNKINITTGSNASIGQSAAMTAGTITISTTAVTASSIIMLVHASTGGTQGILSVGTITAGTSFVINSSSATDTGTVNWWIIN